MEIFSSTETIVVINPCIFMNLYWDQEKKEKIKVLIQGEGRKMSRLKD